MNNPLITAQNVHKRYWMGGKELPVLRGVNLAVTSGDYLAVRGASGTGKSTLLHLLGGLDVPQVGEVTFAGQKLKAMSPKALAQFRNRKIGFVFQAYHLLPELDALENVCLPARLARVDAAAAERRGRELLARVGLAERLHHRPWQLSGGEQQRVAIARALINEPALILADEPTGNLDAQTGDEIINLLCALQAEKRTTLLVATHDNDIAVKAQRTVELANGLLV